MDKMKLKSIKKKVLPYALSALTVILPILGMNGCSKVKAQEDYPANQPTQIYYRSLGQERHKNGAYTLEHQSAKGLSRDRTRYMEELSIKDYGIDGNEVSIEVSQPAKDYADTDDCREGVVLTRYNPSTKQYSDIVAYNEKISDPVEIPADNNINDLRVGVYCTHNDDKFTEEKNDAFTEILASVPLNKVSQGYKNPVGYNKTEKPFVSTQEPSGKKGITNLPTAPQSGSSVSEGKKEIPRKIKASKPFEASCSETGYNVIVDGKEPDESYEDNDTNEIRQANYNKGGSFKIKLKDELKFNESPNLNYVNLKSLDSILIGKSDENEISFVITQKDDTRSYLLPFTYQNEFGCDETDILRLIVKGKNTTPDVNTGSFNLPLNITKDTSQQKLTLDYIIANIKNDGFSADVYVKPFLRLYRVNATENPVYNKQMSINEALRADKKSELEIAKLKKSGFGRKSRVLDKDKKRSVLGQDNNVVNTKLGFSYKQKRVGVNGTYNGIPELTLHQNNSVIIVPKYSDGIDYQKSLWKVKDNEYLYVLEGYDNNKKLVDLDAILIEINANLTKKYMEGFLAGFGVGGISGTVIGANFFAGGNESVKTVKIIADGTKTGGNIPK